MAYQPPPPRSPYGDELLDDNSPISSASPPQAYDRQREPILRPAYGAGQNQGLPLEQPSQTTEKSLTQLSLTQEDISFMRGWQRDSFYRRVIPFSLVGCFSLWAYNRYYKLPYNLGRCALVCCATYFLGKFSYASELKKRLSESRLNTPYMQAMRSRFGLNPIVFSDQTDASQDFGYAAGIDSTDWDSTELVGDMNLGATGSPAQSPYRQPIYNPNSQPLSTDNSIEDSPKRNVTYDEMRARNRGLVR